jgi:hypothetical protein
MYRISMTIYIIHVKTYAVDVNTSCTLEEGAHSPQVGQAGLLSPSSSSSSSSSIESLRKTIYRISPSWPRGTGFPQLPSSVTRIVDHPLGSPSLRPSTQSLRPSTETLQPSTNYKVLPAHNEDVPTHQSHENYVNTYTMDVNTSRTPEEGAYSPSWPNRLILIIITY